MTAASDTPQGTVKSLLRRIGLDGLLPGAAAGDGRGAPPARPGPTGLAGKELLDVIASFLLENGLEVSPANLLAAHGAFSGENRELARAVAARLAAGEAISQDWLDEIVRRTDRGNERVEFEKLASKLEANLETFTKMTAAAQTATTDYNDALEQQAARLREVGDSGSVLTSLTELTKTMLDSVRHVNEQMRRSEAEAKTLRKSLARAKRDAEIDHLTGLPNRRAFEALLDAQFREARAAVENLCVAFCDVDHFKRINDSHGHDTGDRVLKVIAQSLAKISNETCHVARHGGEEFVMLFRGMTTAQAFERLDEVREAFAERRLVNRKSDEPFGQITFSGGIADVFAHASPRAALKAADEALLRAKQEGRNRILIAAA